MNHLYIILDRKFYRSQVSLLRTCEKLHDITTGTASCHEPVTPWFLFQYLYHAVKYWIEDEPNYNGYSVEVKALLLRVLSEYARFFDVKYEQANAEKFAKEFPAETDAILSQICGTDGEKITVRHVDK